MGRCWKEAVTVKRVISLMLAYVLLISLAGCKGEEIVDEEKDIALLIATKGDIELNDFLNGAYRACNKYAEESGKGFQSYEVEQNTYENRLEQAIEAVENGAEVLVMPGYHLEPVTLALQDEHSEVKFLQMDGVPNNGEVGEDYEERISSNTYAVLYAEQEAGFLAGFAAVMDGFTKLGFFGGMAVPAVKSFGYGFLQGAEYAAEKLELAEGDIEVKYLYCGGFNSSPEYQAKASAWYYDGTEVIFSCGGAIVHSVIAAAEKTEDTWIIGVDTDQSEISERIITSAVKRVEETVYKTLGEIYNGGFEGGASVVLGTSSNGVGLEMENARFRQFTKAQYDEIYSELSTNKNGLADSILKDEVELEDIPLSRVKLAYETMGGRRQ